jgi:outer membrane protein assembly factor BamB
VAYAPATGEELWRVNFGAGHAVVPRPVFAHGLVYVCTGYMKPQLWAIRAGGSGDVTSTHVAWKYDKQVPEISSPIVVGDELYFVSSLGVLSCLDARRGELVWQHRLGGNYAASPLAADGKLYFTSREGVTTVLRPGRKYEELARNTLFGQTYASLAVAGQTLFLRADRTLYCLGKP